MMLDNMNIKQLIEIINLLQPKPPCPDTIYTELSPQIGQYVLIRTYSAGVHFGVLARKDNKEVELHKAKRIYSWQGANTLSEISLHGISVGSKISEVIPSIVLTEAIEIIPCSNKAAACLIGLSWGK